MRKHAGTVAVVDGNGYTVPVPRWTNREAVAVVMALRDLARGVPGGFPLWYQFAAVAYAWAPDEDQLWATAEQADAEYPPADSIELQSEAERIVAYLDRVNHPDPRVELNDAFGKASTLSDVSRALREDGAEPETSFKIPLPACKGADGRPAKPVRGTDGKWRCPNGAVTIDDPITAIAKKLSPLAWTVILLAAGAAWVEHGKNNAARRRGRRTR